MFLCSLIEELCTKEENDKTGCNFNFGHDCTKSDYHRGSLTPILRKNVVSYLEAKFLYKN